MTWGVHRRDDDKVVGTASSESEAQAWINERTMPWEFYAAEIVPSLRPRWQPAISLDGEVQVFFLFRPDGLIHMEDGKIVRFPDDIQAMRVGLAMDLAEYRERKAAEKEVTQ